MRVTSTINSTNDKFPGKWLLLLTFFLLSLIPIYRNFYYSNGLATYARHKAVIEKRSEFYNPWQYRILCPYTIEALLFVYDNTIDKIYPIEQKIRFSISNTSGTIDKTDELVEILRTPGGMKHMLIFILFRFFEHVVIFYLCWRYWLHFVKNKWMVFFAINFVALSFGNAVAVADLSLNSYMDIILYLTAGVVIVEKKNPYWLIPITILAAFNRETGLMIPGLYLISLVGKEIQLGFGSLTKKMSLKTLKIWGLTFSLFLIFITIFLAIRLHYGYRPPQVWKAEAGLPMLKLNLFSAVGFKAYMEHLSTFGIIQIVVLLIFRNAPDILKKWFVYMVPAWYIVHYVSVVAYQTRPFMTPFLLIFVPIFLVFLEKSFRESSSDTSLGKTGIL